MPFYSPTLKHFVSSAAGIVSQFQTSVQQSKPVLEFAVAGPYSVGGASQTEVMLTRATENLDISSAVLLVQQAGSGGTLQVDVEYSTNSGSSWTSVFATKPSVAAASGNYATGAGTLTSPTLSIPSGAILRLNINQIQTGSAVGFVLQLK